MTKLQGQAIADSKYDPVIPPPIEGFSSQNMGLGLVAAALLVGLHMYLRPKCWPTFLYK